MRLEVSNDSGSLDIRVSTNSRKANMLYWAAVFLIIAIVAGVLGFGGIAGAATEVAKILFVIFLVLFLVGIFLGWRAV